MLKNLFSSKSMTGLLFSVTVMIFGAELQATEARSGGMGITSASENTWAVEGQLPYIYTNPAAIGNFGPMIFGEYGVFGGNGKGGIIIQPVSALDIGFFVGHAADVAGVNIITANNPNPNPGPGPIFLVAPTLNHQNAMIMGKYSFGNFTLGAGFSFAGTAKNGSSKDTNTKIDITQKSSTQVIKPVVGFSIDGKVKFDGSFAYRINSVNTTYENKNGTTKDEMTASYKNNGIGDIITDFQIIFELGNHLLHATVGADYLDRNSQYTSSSKVGGVTTTNEMNFFSSGYKIKGGISDELKITNDVLAFVGIGFALVNTKTTTASTKTVVNGGKPVTGYLGTFTNDQTNPVTMPMFLGMEAGLGEKWKARFGVTADVLNLDNSKVVTARKASGTSKTATSDQGNDSVSTFFGGLTLTLNNVSFDWNINVPLLTAGPYFISGAPVPGLATDFAISYKFGTGSEKTPLRKQDFK